MVDWWSNIARRKLNAASEWRGSKLESVGPDAVVVTGGVPRILTRGKRKGVATWKGVPCESCVVTRAELAAEQIAYEVKTGCCSQCYGKAQEAYGWTKGHGAMYRDCPKCKGAGTAQL